MEMPVNEPFGRTGDTRSRPLRVFVIDDHPMIRHGLAAMIKAEREFEWVGDAADGTRSSTSGLRSVGRPSGGRCNPWERTIDHSVRARCRACQ